MEVEAEAVKANSVEEKVEAEVKVEAEAVKANSVEVEVEAE